MRTIIKGREPKALETYRLSPGATFSNLPKEVKKQIRIQLVEEQRGLCCYCQSRIRADRNGLKIEHWQSQSEDKFPERQLDYTNLLGACLGGQKHGKKSPRQTHHCDTAKDDADICFSVCDPAHPIERKIRFLGNGTIKAEDVAIDEALNAVLNLNLPLLVNNRRAVLEAFQQRLQKGRRVDPARELPKWDGGKPGELPEFAQVVVYWLRKKQARVAV
ncbi:retron system putative HNH endonuclease [Acetobacter persici]|uniref:TIGR02646 family protein n=1 Tax=Acetobacter persici TaxID=1076596 RepID=A0A6V8I895_9PROT|nr:retron system putative HNH endonuclease [Acetobacter persici]OUI93865.1 hypothetical protein HK19_00235 [Acetobacter persici]GFE93829.1 hypothetical protein DmAi_18880 [Acetobacter persici]